LIEKSVLSIIEFFQKRIFKKRSKKHKKPQQKQKTFCKKYVEKLLKKCSKNTTEKRQKLLKKISITFFKNIWKKHSKNILKSCEVVSYDAAPVSAPAPDKIFRVSLRLRLHNIHDCKKQ
jgi:hypothetical protein